MDGRSASSSPAPPARPGPGSRVLGLLRGRCPRCLRGPIFRGQFSMHPRCPTCGLALAREEGYFTGAMIFSYTFAVPILGALTLGLVLLTGWSLEWILLAASIALLVLLPGIFRYSRIAWIYLDRLVDPGDDAD